MNFLSSMDISSSGLTAQRLRMDTIASNIANVETTRSPNGTGAYRRQVVVLEAKTEQERRTFKSYLKNATYTNSIGQGVRVKQIRGLSDAEAPFRMVFDPNHPDANAQGYVEYPNVNIVEEMVNMISTSRAYDANSKAIEASKAMAMRALEIGR